MIGDIVQELDNGTICKSFGRAVALQQEEIKSLRDSEVIKRLLEVQDELKQKIIVEKDLGALSNMMTKYQVSEEDLRAAVHYFGAPAASK